MDTLNGDGGRIDQRHYDVEKKNNLKSLELWENCKNVCWIWQKWNGIMATSCLCCCNKWFLLQYLTEIALCIYFVRCSISWLWLQEYNVLKKNDHCMNWYYLVLFLICYLLEIYFSRYLSIPHKLRVIVYKIVFLFFKQDLRDQQDLTCHFIFILSHHFTHCFNRLYEYWVPV